MIDATTSSSTRPYLIRALHEWCTDNGLTPYLAVRVGAGVRVPMEFVKDGEIVLNISLDATSVLRLGNEYIEFKARFSGVSREILVPVNNVEAIYARENGQGMVFPSATSVTDLKASSEHESATESVDNKNPQDQGPRTFQLSRVETSNSDVETGDDDMPPNSPRPPSGPRPTLTRIK